MDPTITDIITLDSDYDEEITGEKIERDDSSSSSTVTAPSPSPFEDPKGLKSPPISEKSVKPPLIRITPCKKPPPGTIVTKKIFPTSPPPLVRIKSLPELSNKPQARTHVKDHPLTTKDNAVLPQQKKILPKTVKISATNQIVTRPVLLWVGEEDMKKFKTGPKPEKTVVSGVHHGSNFDKALQNSISSFDLQKQRVIQEQTVYIPDLREFGNDSDKKITKHEITIKTVAVEPDPMPHLLKLPNNLQPVKQKKPRGVGVKTKNLQKNFKFFPVDKMATMSTSTLVKSPKHAYRLIAPKPSPENEKKNKLQVFCKEPSTSGEPNLQKVTETVEPKPKTKQSLEKSNSKPSTSSTQILQKPTNLPTTPKNLKPFTTGTTISSKPTNLQTTQKNMQPLTTGTEILQKSTNLPASSKNVKTITKATSILQKPTNVQSTPKNVQPFTTGTTILQKTTTKAKNVKPFTSCTPILPKPATFTTTPKKVPFISGNPKLQKSTNFPTTPKNINQSKLATTLKKSTNLQTTQMDVKPFTTGTPILQTSTNLQTTLKNVESDTTKQKTEAKNQKGKFLEHKLSPDTEHTIVKNYAFQNCIPKNFNTQKTAIQNAMSGKELKIVVAKKKPGPKPKVITKATTKTTFVNTKEYDCRNCFIKNSAWDFLEPEFIGFNEREKNISLSCQTYLSTLRQRLCENLAKPNDQLENDFYYTRKIEMLNNDGPKLREVMTRKRKIEKKEIGNFEYPPLKKCKITIKRDEVIEKMVRDALLKGELDTYVQQELVFSSMDSTKPLIILNSENFCILKLNEILCTFSNVIYVKNPGDEWPQKLIDNSFLIEKIRNKVIRLVTSNALRDFFELYRTDFE